MKRIGRPPAVVLESRDWLIVASLGGGAGVAWDADERVAVILHGEIYDDREGGARSIAERYRLTGDALFPSLNGSHALLVLDRDRDRVQVVIDRVASRRLFWSEADHGHWITSDLRDQPRDHRDLDPVAVGWALASQACRAGRTPYEGVRVLDCATSHELGTTGLSASRYWCHWWVGPTEPVPYERRVREFGDRLVEAVRRRVADEPDIFLSLSGGLDSTGIAAILAEVLGVKDVRAYSYASRPEWGKTRDLEAGPDLDAPVAAGIAAQLGFSHRTLDSFGGDVVADLELHGSLHDGVGSPPPLANEAPALGPELAKAARPVILVGDEYLGPPERRVTAKWEVWHHALRLRELELPLSVRRTLPPGVLRTMRHGIALDLAGIEARQGPTDDLVQLYDRAVHDQFNVHHVGPWRERYLGRFATVRTPWFDPEVLDYALRVPYEDRLHKRLYRDAVARLSPSFGAFRRSSHIGYLPEWHGLVVRQDAELRTWIGSFESRLDELLPPDFGFALLDEITGKATAGWSIDRLVHGVRTLARRAPGSTRSGVRVPIVGLFLRWAILRATLRVATASDMGPVGPAGRADPSFSTR